MLMPITTTNGLSVIGQARNSYRDVDGTTDWRVSLVTWNQPKNPQNLGSSLHLSYCHGLQCLLKHDATLACAQAGRVLAYFDKVQVMQADPGCPEFRAAV